MKNTNSCRGSFAVMTLAALLRFSAGHGAVTLTSSGFGPSSPSAAGPRIVWTPPAAGAQGNFTLTSAASSDSSNRYVSFAFANGQRMGNTLTIVDCYEIGGVVMLGTSKNLPSGTNVNDPASRNQVVTLSATKRDGVLTCSFTMNFTATLEVYVILATGLLESGATVSSPGKQYHGVSGHFVSERTIGQMQASAGMMTPPSNAPDSSMTSKLTSVGFGPSSSSVAGPRIVWTTPAANAPGNFTLTSAASSDSSNRYVSFAFAKGPKMGDTLTIVDCYEIGGVVMLGTSKNLPNGTNVNDPASRNQVVMLSATKRDGVLTCSFTMNFTATLEVYVILATGLLESGATASSPAKQYHGVNGHFVSQSTFATVLPSAATVTPSSTKVPDLSMMSTQKGRGFGPSSLPTAGPRIFWTAPAANEQGNFTLTSAASSDSSNRYVSFAFANGQKMGDTLTIVDCYEIGGVVMLGTSKNTPSGSNVDDPASRNQVQLLSANKHDGMLMCSFSMKFTSTLDVYAILAGGLLESGASASSHMKQYHNKDGRFVSDSTVKQMLSSASATTSSLTTFVLLATTTFQAFISQ